MHIAWRFSVEIPFHNDADAPWVLAAFRLVEFGVHPAICIDPVVEAVAGAATVVEKDELDAAATTLDGPGFGRFRFQPDRI